MSGGVLLYVDAKSVERNEAYESFQQSANLVVRAGVQRGKLLRAHPLLQRLAILQGLKLALPDFSDQD